MGDDFYRDMMLSTTVQRVMKGDGKKLPQPIDVRKAKAATFVAGQSVSSATFTNFHGEDQDEPQLTGDETAKCALHGKERKITDMEENADGNFVCKLDSRCNISGIIGNLESADKLTPAPTLSKASAVRPPGVVAQAGAESSGGVISSGPTKTTGVISSAPSGPSPGVISSGPTRGVISSAPTTSRPGVISSAPKASRPGVISSAPTTVRKQPGVISSGPVISAKPTRNDGKDGSENPNDPFFGANRTGGRGKEYPPGHPLFGMGSGKDSFKTVREPVSRGYDYPPGHPMYGKGAFDPALDANVGYGGSRGRRHIVSEAEMKGKPVNKHVDYVICGLHGKRRIEAHMVRDEMGGWVCPESDKCVGADVTATGAAFRAHMDQVYTCSIHGKMRHQDFLEKDANGNVVCIPEFPCKVQGTPHFTGGPLRPVDNDSRKFSGPHPGDVAYRGYNDAPYCREVQEGGKGKKKGKQQLEECTIHHTMRPVQYLMRNGRGEWVCPVDNECRTDRRGKF